MRNLEAAEQILQAAVDADVEHRPFDVDIGKVLDEIGPQTFHIVYYDGGFAQNKEIRRLINENPDGNLTRLISALIEARSGEYNREKLATMYGLLP